MKKKVVAPTSEQELYNKETKDYLTKVFKEAAGVKVSVVFPVALELALECIHSLEIKEMRDAYRKVIGIFVEKANAIR